MPQFAPDEIIPSWDNTLGVDAVLHENDYLATSDGEKLPSLKSFRKFFQKLAKISRRKAKQNKGSAKRRILAKKEARQHQKIARARADHAYKTAQALVRTGKKVFVREDLNLRSLTKRNQAKKDQEGKYLPNGQSAKSGLNKSWLDAAFGNFFSTLEYIAVKAGARVIAVNPSYTSQFLCYRDEKVFTDCDIRKYWDETEKILVDRDINAAINIKRVGLGLFLTLNRRSGKISKSFTDSTAKQVLEVLKNAPEAHTNHARSVSVVHNEEVCNNSCTFMSVLAAIAVLALLIVVHELGHFLAARLQGIYANRFSVGFGPILLKYQGSETEYAIRAFPLGGFVGFPDDDPDSKIPPNYSNLLRNRPILDRAILISAGVIANLIFAYFLLVTQIGFVGVQDFNYQPGVSVPEVASKISSAATKAGIKAGDIVLAVEGSN